MGLEWSATVAIKHLFIVYDYNQLVKKMNDISYDSDDLQTPIYYLCYSFALCIYSLSNFCSESFSKSFELYFN